MEPVDAHAWDRFVAAHSGGHHEQTSGYGANRREHGFEVDRVLVRDGDAIAGGAQVLVQRTPIGRMAHVLRAPLVREASAAAHARVAHAVIERAREAGWVSLRFDTFPPQQALREALEEAGCRASDAWTGVRCSRACRLDQDDDALLSDMHPKGRYNVRVARRAGVTVARGGREAVAGFHALHRETAAYQGFPVFPPVYYEYLMRLFGPAERALIFTAELNGREIAAIFTLVVDGRMYYCWGGLDRRREYARTMANYLLHFEAMRAARRLGCTEYDLVGDSQFKRKLTGRLVAWPRPRRAFLGALARPREWAFGYAGTRPRLRRLVERAASRLALRPRMPW